MNVDFALGMGSEAVNQPEITAITPFSGIGGIRYGLHLAAIPVIWSSESNLHARIVQAANFPPGTPFTHPVQPIPTVVLAPNRPTIAALTLTSAHFRANNPKVDGGRHVDWLDWLKIIDSTHPHALLIDFPAPRASDLYDTALTDLVERGFNLMWRNYSTALVAPQRRDRMYVVGIHNRLTTEIRSAYRFPEIIDERWTLADILEPDSAVEPSYTLSNRAWEGILRRSRENTAVGWRYELIDPNGTASTLNPSYFESRHEILIPQQGKNPRILTPTEARRLMGFPDYFELPIPNTYAYRLLAQSSTPTIIRQIAYALKKSLIALLGVRPDDAGRVVRAKPAKPAKPAGRE